MTRVLLIIAAAVLLGAWLFWTPPPTEDAIESARKMLGVADERSHPEETLLAELPATWANRPFPPPEQRPAVPPPPDLRDEHPTLRVLRLLRDVVLRPKPRSLRRPDEANPASPWELELLADIKALDQAIALTKAWSGLLSDAFLSSPQSAPLTKSARLFTQFMELHSRQRAGVNYLIDERNLLVKALLMYRSGDGRDISPAVTSAREGATALVPRLLNDLENMQAIRVAVASFDTEPRYPNVTAALAAHWPAAPPPSAVPSQDEVIPASVWAGFYATDTASTCPPDERGLRRPLQLTVRERTGAAIKVDFDIAQDTDHWLVSAEGTYADNTLKLFPTRYRKGDEPPQSTTKGGYYEATLKGRTFRGFWRGACSGTLEFTKLGP